MFSNLTTTPTTIRVKQTQLSSKITKFDPFVNSRLSSTVNYEIQSMFLFEYALTFESTKKLSLSSDHFDEASASVLSHNVISLFSEWIYLQNVPRNSAHDMSPSFICEQPARQGERGIFYLITQRKGFSLSSYQLTYRLGLKFIDNW